MIREKASNKDMSGKRGFYIIVAISVGTVFLSTIVGYIQKRFNINHLEWIIYGLLIVTAYIVIKRYITEYRYSFFDDELIVEQIIGKKIEPVASIRTWEIKYFGKISKAKWGDNTVITKCDVNKTGTYAIIYEKDGTEHVVTLSPSEELITQVKTAMDTLHYTEVNEDKIIK